MHFSFSKFSTAIQTKQDNMCSVMHETEKQYPSIEWSHTLNCYDVGIVAVLLPTPSAIGQFSNNCLASTRKIYLINEQLWALSCEPNIKIHRRKCNAYFEQIIRCAMHLLIYYVCCVCITISHVRIMRNTIPRNIAYFHRLRISLLCVFLFLCFFRSLVSIL